VPNIVTSKAPNLPLPTPAHDPKYDHQVNNSLRLYFNQVDNSTAQLATAANSGAVQQWLDGGCF